MPKNPKRRVIMRIKLYPEAKDELINLSDRLGMTQVTATSRVITWLAAQSDVAQASVLGLYPSNNRVDVAELTLRKMAADKKKG